MPPLTLRTALRGLLLLAALGWIPWALATWFDLDRFGWIVPSAVAFLPYALAITALVLVAALVARARAAATIALIGVLVLGIPRIDRLTHDPQPTATGPVITVANTNVYTGLANTRELIRLVRAHHVDVLAIEESTAPWEQRAQREGLHQLLPYGVHVDDNRSGAEGLAVWSRWPIRRADITGDAERSLGGIVSVPAGGPLHVRAAHPYPPFNSENLGCWERCTRALATARHAAPNTILAGDYNATLDHHPIRNLTAHGYRDAAEQVGYGWRPTWSNGSWAGLSIDHLFVTDRIAVRGVTAHDLPHSDHDVVIARVQLPRATTP